ncbi:hypothetical protein [Bacillus sp. MUM 13]|uniref:hypothetical protein n=1 Tax=Bacillus sp. MUM 13 TaxID=1678001 RepID=UPI0008F5D6F4|nr:hypothetical protein [Bacillus sp. MUM 13]OIK14890.1 hypothetical protein BIV59_01545 [Bacillus sp. MUM 13]
MNTYKIKFYCGQISFVRKFFNEYQDEKVKTVLLSETKITAVFEVVTSLSGQEAEQYLMDIFKKSKYGPALYYTASCIK